MNQQPDPPQPNNQQADQPVVPPKPEQSDKPHPLVWVILALLAIFLALGAYFLYIQTQKPLDEPVPTQAPQPTTQPSPTPGISPTPQDLAVPTVSEDTSLETIEQELNQLEAASPDSELNQLESEIKN